MSKTRPQKTWLDLSKADLRLIIYLVVSWPVANHGRVFFANSEIVRLGPKPLNCNKYFLHVVFASVTYQSPSNHGDFLTG